MLPSKFGYIIIERYPDMASIHHRGNLTTLLVVTRLCQEDYHDLHCSVSISSVKNPDLETFWSLELVGITDPIDRGSDDEALEKFCESIKFREGTKSLYLGNQIEYVYLTTIMLL